LLAASVSGTALDGTAMQAHAPVLQLPVLDAAALQALPRNETAYTRLEELAFAKASEHLRQLAKDGDRQATQQALDVLEKRFGHHPWLSAKIKPKSGSYPVVGKPDVGFGGPMMGAMRSLM
jgi:hypothetical protein